jgi:hypothetical protein
MEWLKRDFYVPCSGGEVRPNHTTFLRCCPDQVFHWRAPPVLMTAPFFRLCSLNRALDGDQAFESRLRPIGAHCDSKSSPRCRPKVFSRVSTAVLHHQNDLSFLLRCVFSFSLFSAPVRNGDCSVSVLDSHRVCGMPGAALLVK